jgi:hypothetical protein
MHLLCVQVSGLAAGGTMGSNDVGAPLNSRAAKKGHSLSLRKQYILTNATVNEPTDQGQPVGVAGY